MCSRCACKATPMHALFAPRQAPQQCGPAPMHIEQGARPRLMHNVVILGPQAGNLVAVAMVIPLSLCILVRRLPESMPSMP